ncbi:MAG: tetratricopeptide repeat protein [Maioricimonas sp. JB049]
MSRREKLEELLKSSPDDAFLNYGLAMEEAREGNLEAALAQLDRVLTLDPDYVAAFFQQGQLLAREERLTEARQRLSAGIAVADRVGDAHAAGEMREFLAALPE